MYFIEYNLVTAAAVLSILPILVDLRRLPALGGPGGHDERTQGLVARSGRDARRETTLGALTVRISATLPATLKVWSVRFRGGASGAARPADAPGRTLRPSPRNMRSRRHTVGAGRGLG